MVVFFIAFRVFKQLLDFFVYKILNGNRSSKHY